MLELLETYFEFRKLGTTWRAEILAGVTTFLTMAYIVLVNPAILSSAGVPLHAATVATCLSAASGSLLMGIVARYPIALAPGMGLNAYFAYTVCLKMHVPWQTALGAVFISGILFLALTAAGIRQMILRSIPHELYAAVASGIGLFIAFIGFRNAGLIVGDSATLVSLGNLRNPTTALALFGLILMVGLEIRRVRGAILIGVLVTTGIAWVIGLVQWKSESIGLHDLTKTALQLDIHGALSRGLLEIIFVFFFVDLFDNLGTLVAVTKRAGLIAPDHTIPRLNRILFVDAASTIFGSLAGTSTVTSYVESTAGVAAAGGRSGVTAIVAALLFLVAMVAAPFVGLVPNAATAPALILVGSMMLATITEIRWHEPLVAIPAFLTLILIPLTYSIANGLGFGVIAWAVLHLATGNWRRQDWLLYILAILFALRFLYLGAG
ncbi:MAG: NCS2 family permease [Acidobacteria bacterium]|nr:NCS2 family permease [Acidobacteriota bacterium]